MKKKLLFIAALSMLLTGCTVKVPIGTDTVSRAEKLAKDVVESDTADKSKEKVEDVKNTISEAIDDYEKATTSSAMDITWTYDSMDEQVQKFYVDMYGWELLTHDLDKVLLTDLSIEEPSSDVGVYRALQDFMLIKYSGEWNIGLDSDADTLVEWEDLDELAQKFGFESSQYASDIYDYVEDQYVESLPEMSVEPVVTWDYDSTFLPTLGELTYADGTTPTMVKTKSILTDDGDDDDQPLNTWAYFTYDDKCRTKLSIPLVATTLVEYNGEHFWICVPNAWPVNSEDLSFDTHSDVTILADWSILLDDMDNADVAYAVDLDHYNFKEDHGIVIIRESYLSKMDELEFLENIVEYTESFEDTDYTVELDHMPTKEEFATALPPYKVWENYFGLTDMNDGANIERLAGDYSHWNRSAE